MKVSIITVCLNSANTILRTIRSVNAQTHNDIEHVFIDGGSTDGTLDVIRKHAERASVIISEKDRGIYDAMNKGILLATGDIIGTLNSDDWYASERSIETVVKRFSEQPIEFYCANLSFFDGAGRYSHDFGKEPTLANNRNEMSVAHPCLYIRRKLVSEVGFFNLDYRVASDYDWCLRMINKGYPYHYDAGICVNMSLGGASSKYNRRKFAEEYAIKNYYFPERARINRVCYVWAVVKDMVKTGFKAVGLSALLSSLRTMQGKRRVCA